ncbi:hypothetical protein PRIPAC_74880 [Pristionchus pacificus]|nr:hypothetical protein PRIPAC_74880 [Pristionchus pacificus]
MDRLLSFLSLYYCFFSFFLQNNVFLQILAHEVECLHTEQTNAIMGEPNLDDNHRSLLYGLTASLGIMVESINERNLQLSASDKEKSINGCQDASRRRFRSARCCRTWH